MNIEDRIEKLIKENGYSKIAFAEKMGIKKQNINAMLKSPSYPTLEKIARALEIPMWQLFVSPEELEEKDVIVCPNCHARFKMEDK